MNELRTNKRKDYNWQKFWRLTVIKDLDNIRSLGGKSHRMVECKCECGNIKSHRLEYIISWNTKSCWCYREENTKKMVQNHFARIGYAKNI